jgi:opacity protein-like surface antigen
MANKIPGTVVAIAIAALISAAPAAAQPRPDEPSTPTADQLRPLPAERRFGFRAFGHFEMVSMTAKETFDAVLGSRSMRGPGGGGEVLGLWKGLFARVAVSQMKDEGTRAFVFGGDVISMNVPLTVKIRTIEIGGGWRVQPRRAPRLAAYGGGGLLLLQYDETSAFADSGENPNESFNGYLAFAGAEFALSKWLVAGAEAQYRAVPDALGGVNSIPELFNESDLGGVAVRVLFGIRR